MRDVHKHAFSSRMDFMMLLSHPSIRSQAGIDDEEYAELSRLEQSFFDEIWSVYQEQRDQPLAHQDLVKKIVEVVHSHDEEFMELFRTTTDFDRFIGILVQVRGTRSVVHEEVAKRINLSPEKLKEIRVLAFRTWREQTDHFGDKFRELLRGRKGGRPGDREHPLGSNHKEDENRKDGEFRRDHKVKIEKHEENDSAEIRELIERVEEKVNQAVAHKLTTEQLQTLENLRAKSFELPEDIFTVRLPYFPGRRGPPPPLEPSPESPR